VTIPDLLAHEASVRFDSAALAQTLTFAFASGVPGSTFAELAAGASLPPSTWVPSGFAKELFVREFVANCLTVRIAGQAYAIDQAQLARTLALPPRRAADVELRRAVLSELVARDSFRAEFEGLYALAHQARALLEAPPLSRRIDANRRRLEILAALKATFDAMQGSFAGASSQLARLPAFAEHACGGDAYRRLTELLQHDEHLATLDVRIRVGRDGHVRALDLVQASENTNNRFYTSPFGRLWRRLQFALRGYRVTEQEILARIIDSVFEGIEAQVVQLFQLITDMEFYVAALAFRDRALQQGLQVCLPELARPGADAEGLSLVRLFNPLLMTQDVPIVPCDAACRPGEMITIVTGPNSGGKTRLLQSLALSQMLGQSGFFVPASSGRLSLASGLFVSLIEEATADQSEGRLGTELIRIRSLFEKTGVGSMVILDELCSGTNPSEGEEIFELVITLLAELAPQAFITTHFLTLAARLERDPPTPGLAFLQVELDQAQLPTYQFRRGVAVTSLAHRTAARLGVTREELLALVERSRRAATADGPGGL
jgi:DNA mismatch repair protein MutS2